MKISYQNTISLLKKYNIPYAKTYIYSNKVNIPNLEFPVVVKADSDEILHKTEHGLVFTNVSKKDLFKKCSTLKKILDGKKIKKYKILIQDMIKGTEFIIGIKKDPVFGKIIVFGLGGVFVELIKDVSMRALPLSKKDCYEMLNEIRANKIFDGFRGMPPVNKNKLAELIYKSSKLANEVDEMDFNPVIANDKEAIVVDARLIKNNIKI